MYQRCFLCQIYYLQSFFLSVISRICRSSCFLCTITNAHWTAIYKVSISFMHTATKIILRSIHHTICFSLYALINHFIFFARKEDKMVYESIKRKADSVVYTSQNYFRGCMHKRNRYLVDSSSVCICYCTKKTGGTAYTTDYAQKKRLQIINLA